MQEILRRYATPLALVGFAVLGLSGTLMFFGVRGRQLNEIHEWVGIFFVVIAVLHVMRNAKSFTFMLRQKHSKRVIWVLGVVSVLLLGNAFYAMATDGPSPRRVQIMLTNRLADAPLGKLAPALGLSDEAAVARLQIAGIKAVPAQSLNQVAAANGKSATDLYLMLMGGGQGGSHGSHKISAGH